MYEIVANIINHAWTSGSSEQQYIYYICGALIGLFSVVIVDIVRDIFSSFLRG